ncbi:MULTISPECIES: hypothetical protein [unclassified Enterococcus]|uniref:hypothetical protein n=1 Tax=unclassified Enterococcus TaxID=2608891 RepID=UPI0013EAD940|nr:MULTISPECIES: hypothetical protein [unclassified Enterococcus]
MEKILSIIGTGIPGFLSYWYLSKQGLLDFNKDRKDEKIIVLSAFSALNIFFTLIASILLYKYFNINLKFENMNISQILIVFILGVLISILFTTTLYPFVIDKAIQKIDNKINEKGKPNLINRHILKELLYNNSNKYPAIYLFERNEEKTFIESGFLEYLGDIEDNLQLMLSGKTFSTTEKIEYEEVLKMFNGDKYKTEDKHIYIDIKQNIIMFIFFIEKE